MTTAPSPAASLSFMDDQPFSRLQIRTLVLCAVVAMLDGNDTQIIGIGAPAIAAALHVAPSAMGWVISGSWVGAGVGAVTFGGIADRVGRKPMMIMAVLMFGLLTLLTPFAHDLPSLIAVRLLGCVGLGGATPCFISLASEYTPARWRATMVSLVYAAFPLGILVGGLVNGWILSRSSWQQAFYVGGAAPIVVAVLLLALLPESLGWLLTCRPGDRRIASLVAAIGPNLRLQPAVGIATGDLLPPRRGVSPLDVLRFGNARATLALWLLLFACFGTTASTVWLPTILQQNGVTPAASAVTASFAGLGSLVGFIVAGQLVDRFGLVRALAGPIVAGAAATAALGLWPGSPQTESIFVALLGALVGMGVSGGVSVVPWVYPMALRSSGAGWAMGLGRAGQVTIPGVIAVLLHYSWTAYGIFLALGCFTLLAAAGVLLLASSLAPASSRSFRSPSSSSQPS